MTPAKKTKQPSGQDAATLVYCGPNIPGVANRFTFYRCGVPAHLERKAEEIPEIRGLLVPLAEFPEAMKKLRTGSGRVYRLYRLVQEKI